MGRDGRLLWAGAGMRRLLGRDPVEMFGMPVSEVVHPDDLGRPGGLRDLALGTATHFERDYRLRHADGSWRVFDIRVADLRDEPTIGAFLVTGRDITDRAATEEANRRMAAAIDSSGAVVVVTDPAGKVLACNHQAEELDAVTSDDGTGRQLRIGGLLPVDRASEVHRSLLEGTTVTFDVTIGQTTDRATVLSVTASPVTDASGTTTAFSFIAFDITAQRAMAAEREAHARRARALADLGQRALSGASLADVMEDACGLAAAAMDLTQVHVQLFDAEEGSLRMAAAVGTGASSLPRSEPLDARPWIAAVDDQRRPVVVEHFGRTTGGIPRALEELGVLSGVLCTIDGGGTPIGWLNALDSRERRYDEAEVGFLQSIANVLATTVERNRASDELARRALHDELTGLPNRALLLDRLSQGMARIERHPGLVGLLFIDIDRFKRVNDTLGHQAGDRLLVATAHRLREAVRADDTVARAGGDEFLVLTEEAEVIDDVLGLAERVAGALAEPIEIDGHRLHVTASIGVAVTSAASDPETLVRDADLAMYRAKQDGRDRIRVFDRTMRRDAFTGMALEEALRTIATDGGLRVVYQPQVDLVSGDITGVEALARWDHLELGEVPPSEFVPVADDIGVLDDITCIVLRDACATAVGLRQDLPDLTIAVNLTPRQLSRRRVIDMIDDVLGSSALEPSALIVEVTESAALDDGATRRVLADLRSRGIKVAIDDFGTGYSSLSRVTHLPVDEVKIDRSFIGGLTEELGRAAAVSAIVTLSRVLGLRLVAEGVEDEEQRQALLDLGCTEGQGWLFAGGLEADEIGAWARQRAPRRAG
jgi:diguanylate cyclase (GGDEF)-like protein/PAS domain S-box-containing protein